MWREDLKIRCKQWIRSTDSKGGSLKRTRTENFKSNFKPWIRQVDSNSEYQKLHQTMDSKGGFQKLYQTMDSKGEFKQWIPKVISNDGFEWWIRTVNSKSDSQGAFEKWIRTADSNTGFKQRNLMGGRIRFEIESVSRAALLKIWSSLAAQAGTKLKSLMVPSRTVKDRNVADAARSASASSSSIRRVYKDNAAIGRGREGRLEVETSGAARLKKWLC